MASDEIDIFGFDELTKAFERCKKRYPNEADALLMAGGRLVNRRVKQLTPVHKGEYKGSKAGRKRKPGDLKRSWKIKKPKVYKNGTVRVVREQTYDPIGHLIEDGHEVVGGGRKWRRTEEGKREKLTAVQRSGKGIRGGTYAPAYRMLDQAMREAQDYLFKNAEKMIDKLTKDLEV